MFTTTRGDAVHVALAKENLTILKYEKVHEQHARQWDVQFTDSHLICCHYARATLVFKKKKKRGKTKRQRLAYAPKFPWGVSVFLAFQSYAAIRLLCVGPWLRNAAAFLCSITVQDQTSGSSLRLLHDFPNFLLDCDGNESALCAVLKAQPLTDGLVWHSNCCSTLPCRDGGRGRENGNAVWTGRFSKTWNVTCGKEKERKFFSVYYHMHWCDFDTWHLLNVRGLRFCYHKMPFQHSQVCSHVNKDIKIEITEKKRGESKREALLFTSADMFSDTLSGYLVVNLINAFIFNTSLWLLKCDIPSYRVFFFWKFNSQKATQTTSFCSENAKKKMWI